MKLRIVLVALLLTVGACVAAQPVSGTPPTAPTTQCAPAAGLVAAPTAVAFWSMEARCAIVPAGPSAIFGPENFGTKFPGEAAVLMGIVHLAMYDVAVAIEGGYEPYGSIPEAPSGTSPEAAIATAVHDTLIGLQQTNKLGLSVVGMSILEADYAGYLAAIADGPSKDHGVDLGAQVAQAILELRSGDHLDANPSLADLAPPAPGPGIWQPNPTGTVLGLRLPAVRPLGLDSPSDFRPGSPDAITSDEYADDFAQVKELGRLDSVSRSAEETDQARFWTDHDLRQWNDGMLRLVEQRQLGLVESTRMLAMAHVARGDAMIACFDAKFHYWFWRPYQAITLADTDGNPSTDADPGWLPLAPTPNFPEYPSAHACHSSAVVSALTAFFGTDKIALTLDSRAPNVVEPISEYERLRYAVREVNEARVFAGFHFYSSDVKGANLGRKVGRHIARALFQPTDRHDKTDHDRRERHDDHDHDMAARSRRRSRSSHQPQTPHR